MFVWSFFQIHVLLRQMKLRHIQQISHEVQGALEAFKKLPSKENAETLNQLMEIQTKIQRLTEWPISVQGVATFLVTFLSPIVQFLVSRIPGLKFPF
jgi:hypothetical protein